MLYYATFLYFFRETLC